MKGKENSTIVFGKQEITEKKLITQFLLQNQVSFAPTQNVYKDYEAVIKFNKASLPHHDPKKKKQEIPDDNDINLLYQKAGLSQKGKKSENGQSKSNNLPDATKEIAKLILDISKSKKRSAQRANSQSGLVPETKSKSNPFDMPNKENRIGTEKVKISELVKQQHGVGEIENILNTTKTSDFEEDETDQLFPGNKKRFYENGLDHQSCEERLRALYMPDFTETKTSQEKMSSKNLEKNGSKSSGLNNSQSSREALSNISSKASIEKVEFSGENFQTFSLGREKVQEEGLDFLQSENHLVEKIKETNFFGGVQTERGNFTFRQANANQARPLPVPPQEEEEEPVNPPTLQFTGYSMSSVEDLPPKQTETDMSPKSTTSANNKDKRKDRSPKTGNKSFSVSSIGDSKDMRSLEDSKVFKDLVEKENFFAELLSKGSQESRIMDTSLTIVESEVKFKSSRLKKLYESKYSTKEKMPDESDNGSRRPSANQLDKLKSTCHNSKVSSMVLCQDLNEQGSAESDYYASAHFDSFEGQKYLCSNESVTSLNNQQQVNEQFNVFMKSQISMISDNEDRFKKNNNKYQITSSSHVSLADEIRDLCM